MNVPFAAYIQFFFRCSESLRYCDSLLYLCSPYLSPRSSIHDCVWFRPGGGGASTYPDPVVQISRILSLSISDLLKRFYSLIMAGRRCVLSSFRFFHVDCFPFFLSTSKRHTYLKPSSNSEYPACTPAVIIFALHRTVSVCILWREIEIT